MGVEMKTNQRFKSRMNRQRGFATVEAIPVLLVFVILLAYSFGMFGVIHTGILNSISARNYAFETFRNRSNVTYFRDNRDSSFFSYRAVGTRIHGTTGEGFQRTNTDFRATERSLRVGFGDLQPDGSRNNINLHNELIYEQIQDGVENNTVGVSPVWVKTQYGMCINAACGD